MSQPAIPPFNGNPVPACRYFRSTYTDPVTGDALTFHKVVEDDGRTRVLWLDVHIPGGMPDDAITKILTGGAHE